MDYPVPLITADASGAIDLRDAFRTGPGAWDSLSIRLGYTWYPDAATERAGLDAIMKDAGLSNPSLTGIAESVAAMVAMPQATLKPAAEAQ